MTMMTKKCPHVKSCPSAYCTKKFVKFMHLQCLKCDCSSENKHFSLCPPVKPCGANCVLKAGKINGKTCEICSCNNNNSTTASTHASETIATDFMHYDHDYEHDHDHVFEHHETHENETNHTTTAAAAATTGANTIIKHLTRKNLYLHHK